MNISLAARVYFCTSVVRLQKGPLALARQKIFAGEITEDGRQLEVFEKLQKVYNATKRYSPWKTKLFLGPPKGLYIYGSVGSGKTMVMDLFYDSMATKHKRRVHFNQFMTDVHSRIHRAKTERGARRPGDKLQPWDPIKPVARSLTKQAWLLCFDEFQVTDIGDAMILKQLFTELFHNGVVMIATSNRPADDLYKDGLQRANFLPFIAVLKKYCNEVQLFGQDYRRRVGGGRTKYYVGTESSTKREMNNAFQALCANQARGSNTLNVMGRTVKFRNACGGVLDTTFSELCDRPLGASDYVQLATTFHTILIRNVPRMTLDNRNQVRRFITLIDTLYDRRIRIVVSAAAPPDGLFSSVKSYKASDSERATMDDLNINSGTRDEKSSLFTGSEEEFAFKRTVSRLTEMGSDNYWQQKKNKQP